MHFLLYFNRKNEGKSITKIACKNTVNLRFNFCSVLMHCAKELIHKGDGANFQESS